MHQIRFRLGLRPRPHWGSLQRSPRPPSWISGGLLLRAGEGRKRERRGGESGMGRREKGRRRKRGEEKEGERMGREWTPQGFSEMTPLQPLFIHMDISCTFVFH